MALDLQEPAARQGADFRAAKAFEQRHAPVSMRASGGLGADQHQLGGVGRMARGVSQRDHAAERRAQHDRIDDAQGVAERAHVVAPLRQVPALPGTVLAAAIAAMVEIDDLGDVRQGRVGRLVDRVVGAGAAMEHQQGRLFPHGGTVRDQLRALDIEEQPHTVDEHMHGLGSLRQVCEMAVGPRRLLVSSWILNHTAGNQRRIWDASHIFGVLRLSMCSAFDVTPISSSGQNVIQISWNYPRRGDRRDAGALFAGRSRNPMMPIRKCEFSSLRISCGNSPARTRSCNTATGSSKIA